MLKLTVPHKNVLKFELVPSIGTEPCIVQTPMGKHCVSSYETFTVVADNQGEYLRIDRKIELPDGEALSAYVFYKKENSEIISSDISNLLPVPTIFTTD